MRLGDHVPKSVASQFDKLKGMYLDGYYRYEHFTAAERDSYRVLEAALKIRFLQHYGCRIPLLDGGNRREVVVQSFSDVRRLVLQRPSRLQSHPHFNGSLASLLRWSRDVGYFRGQHNRVRELATVHLRNEMFHTEHDLLAMPPDVARSLSLVFQWVQRLWGYETPGGDAYSGAIPRSLHVVGLGPLSGEATWFTLDHLPQAVDEDRDRRIWSVVVAAEREGLSSWRPGFECTRTPVDRVWGPGSWQDLLDAAERNGSVWGVDAVDLLDRTFFIRTTAAGLEAPRSAAQVRSLRDRQLDERWVVITADSPWMAMHHLTDLVGGRHSRQGPCSSCAVTVLMSGSRRETIDRNVKGKGR